MRLLAGRLREPIEVSLDIDPEIVRAEAKKAILAGEHYEHPKQLIYDVTPGSYLWGILVV